MILAQASIEYVVRDGLGAEVLRTLDRDRATARAVSGNYSVDVESVPSDRALACDCVPKRKASESHVSVLVKQLKPAG